MQAFRGETMPQLHVPQDRMPQYQMTRRNNVARIALAAGFAALVVCAYGSAARAGDADSDVQGQESFTDKFMRTLGLKNPGETDYEINYSERSPLVVPPNRDLPPPVTNAVTAPNWPKDPDVARRKADKNDDKPVVQQYDRAAEADRALRPDELNRVSQDPRTVAAPGTPEQSEPTRPKKSIFSLDFFKKEQYATFTGEPPRSTLTDPPPGYLTPSPDQPYGIAPENKPYVPKTLGERMEPTR
jgi:hypothetical protein